MITFEPNFGGHAPRILTLGAHSDDIEIGCGGTIAKMLAKHPDAVVMWVVFSGSDDRQSEARQSAELYTSGLAGVTLRFERFRDGRFPFDAPAIKELFSDALQSFAPDLVFTHFDRDRHQDHRVLSELAWQTFRNHTILEYEVPKYDGDLGCPNVYVELTSEEIARKVERLEACFGSQRSKQWFAEETFRGLARLRGIECAAASGYAEAFHARKVKLG